MRKILKAMLEMLKKGSARQIKLLELRAYVLGHGEKGNAGVLQITPAGRV